MSLPRSTFYDAPTTHLDDPEIVGRVQTICDEFEAYRYRRVGAELRHQGVVVNHKKIRRLMREHDLQPKHRRRYVGLWGCGCGCGCGWKRCNCIGRGNGVRAGSHVISMSS